MIGNLITHTGSGLGPSSVRQARAGLPLFVVIHPSNSGTATYITGVCSVAAETGLVFSHAVVSKKRSYSLSHMSTYIGMVVTTSEERAGNSGGCVARPHGHRQFYSSEFTECGGGGDTLARLGLMTCFDNTISDPMLNSVSTG